MFCENCGTKNDSNAKFCVSCGSLLEFEKPTLSFQKQSDNIKSQENYFRESEVIIKKKPMSLKSKIISIILIVLTAITITAYFFGKHLVSPKMAVKCYIDNMISENYEAMYNCLDLENNEFTSKETYIKLIKDKINSGELKITDYTLMEIPVSDPLIKKFSVVYKTGGSNKTTSMEVCLAKQPSKKWYIYDYYKISENGLTVKDYSITIPKGTEIFLNNIKVDKKYMIEDNAKEQLYIIPSIFQGTYQIKVTGNFCKDKIYEYKINDSTNIYVASVELNEKTKEEISKLSKEFIIAFYDAVSKKAFENIKSYLSEKGMQNVMESFENTIDSIESEYQYYDYSVKSISATPTNTVMSDIYSTKENCLWCGLYFDYAVNWSYSDDYYDYYYDDYYDDYDEGTDSYSSNIKLEFVYENEKWLIANCK